MQEENNMSSTTRAIGVKTCFVRESGIRHANFVRHSGARQFENTGWDGPSVETSCAVVADPTGGWEI